MDKYFLRIRSYKIFGTYGRTDGACQFALKAFNSYFSLSLTLVGT